MSEWHIDIDDPDNFDGLGRQIAEGNCQELHLHFGSPILKLILTLTPLISTLRDRPLIKCELTPKGLPEPKFDVVAVGGTFDYLHIGHQILLLHALQLAKRELIVGVTSASMLSNKKDKQLIQPIQKRIEAVKSYAKSVRPDLELRVQEIFDPFGPTVVRADVHAIVVSQETIKGGEKINEIRKEKNFDPLCIQVCEILSPDNHNFSAKISSSNIRAYLLIKNRLTTHDFVSLQQMWEELCRDILKLLKIEEERAQIVGRWWDKVLHKYSSYWKFHHTNSHILSMLRQCAEMKESEQLSERDRIVLLTAIWFHDIEYFPALSNNEERSASLAQLFMIELTDGYEQAVELSGSIRSAILATKHHRSEAPLERMLIDLDMSILNAQSDVYQQYAEDIRNEYYPVVKAQYAMKRVKFLQSIDPTAVFYYHTDTQRLRNNVEWEINFLQEQVKKQHEQLKEQLQEQQGLAKKKEL